MNTARANSNLRAVVTMLCGVAFFALLDAGLKHLTADYAPSQVMCMRAFASLPFLLAAAAWSRSWGLLRMRNPLLYLGRGLLNVVVLWAFVYALSVQSLSYSYAIFMSAPLMIAALAGPLLGEHVPARRWAAIAVGMGGVIVALRPGGNFVALGGLAAALSAACYALNVVAVRRIGKDDSNVAVVFWNLAVIGVVAGLIAAPGWRAPDAAAWPWVAWCGFTGALGQYFFTAAFRLAPASTIAPFEYTAMVWAVGLDWLVFSLVPALHVLAGAAIVIAAGLYVIFEERRSGQVIAVQMPPG